MQGLIGCQSDHFFFPLQHHAFYEMKTGQIYWFVSRPIIFTPANLSSPAIVVKLQNFLFFLIWGCKRSLVKSKQRLKKTSQCCSLTSFAICQTSGWMASAPRAKRRSTMNARHCWKLSQSGLQVCPPQIIIEQSDEEDLSKEYFSLADVPNRREQIEVGVFFINLFFYPALARPPRQALRFKPKILKQKVFERIFNFEVFKNFLRPIFLGGQIKPLTVHVENQTHCFEIDRNDPAK